MFVIQIAGVNHYTFQGGGGVRESKEIMIWKYVYTPSLLLAHLRWKLGVFFWSPFLRPKTWFELSIEVYHMSCEGMVFLVVSLFTFLSS